MSLKLHGSYVKFIEVRKRSVNMYKLFDWKDKINEFELEEIVKILNNNGVIIFPTETVYGIGGNAMSNEVIDRVYEAKHRPRAKAVNILVANKSVIDFNEEHTWKAEPPIFNNPFGNWTVSIDVNFAKKYFSISVIPSSITTYLIVPLYLSNVFSAL